MQIGKRNPDGQIVWDLSPCDSWVTPSWAEHIKARNTDPAVSLGWIEGWLVHRTHPHIPELADFSFARIRWERDDEPGLFEVPA